MAWPSATTGAVAAVLLLGPLLAATPTVSAQDDIQADYTVTLEREHADAGPQESVTFPILLENHSDEPVRFTFERIDEDRTTGVQAAVPPPIELDGASPGSEPIATANLQVYTPFRNGYVDEDHEVTLRVTPHDPEDPARQGRSTTLTVSVHTEGFYIPGPGLLTALAVLATVAGALGLQSSGPGRGSPNRTRTFRSRQGDS